MDYGLYNFNNLVTQKDRDAVCNDVKLLISEGKYFTNSPRYQTNVNVFGLPGPHWMKLKMSFIMAAFMFLDKEVQIKNIQSWSYMTSLKYPEDRNNLWHHHAHDKSVNSVSGVYYVHVPKKEKACGTEFAPNGPENEPKIMMPPRVGEWLVYPSETWHRPGELRSKQDRFIVAADLQF